jgi:phosphatidylserine decarboxylase
MKHAGRARQAALKLIFWTLVALIALVIAGAVLTFVLGFLTTISLFLFGAWVIFALFTFYFFRDPDPRPPVGPGLVLSPAHGKVDMIDEVNEPLFMGGPCQRISMFLSVLDVHVQNAPVKGKVVFYRYNTGQFLSALKTESATHNENLLMGFQGADPPETKIGIRLIAGVLARRIVPFVKEGDELERGERISLIQFGSRTDLYLPLSARVQVKLNDHVVGGHTVMASF